MSRAQSGDTLVVKDDNEFGGPNTLYLLMHSDSMAPASRVYMLQRRRNLFSAQIIL